MVFFSVWGYMYGEVAQLLAPVDGNGRMCGYDAGVKDFPQLWIADLNKATDNAVDMFDYGVCAKTCPSSTNETLSCVDTTKVANCSSPANTYGTTEMLGYCIPMYDDLSVAQ